MADNNVQPDTIIQLLDLYKRSLNYICDCLEDQSLKDDILPSFPNIADLTEQQRLTYSKRDMYKPFQKIKQRMCDAWKTYAKHAKKADDCKLILKTIWDAKDISGVKANICKTELTEEMEKSLYKEQLKVLTTMIPLLKSSDLEQKKEETRDTLLEVKRHDSRKQESEPKNPEDDTCDSDNDDIETSKSSLYRDEKPEGVGKTETGENRDTKEEQADGNSNAESEKRENNVTDVLRPSDLGDKTSTETNKESPEPMDTTECGDGMEIDDTLRVADNVSQSATEKENEVTTLSQNLDSTKEKYKKKIQKLKQQIEEKESALSQLEENFREMQDSMAQITQDKEQLIQHLESIQKVPDGKLKKQIVSLEKALKNSREQTEKLSRLCGEKEQAYSKLLSEKKSLEKSSSAERPKTAPVRQYQEMQNLVESPKGEKESLMQRIEERESALSQVEENFREMQDSMAQITQDKEQLIQDLESILKVPDGKLKKQIVSLEKDLKKSREQTEKLSRLCVEKEQAYSKLLSEKKEKSPERPQTAPVRQYKEMQNLVESLKGEKESLMQRLSMVAGMKMKDNNPAIADLSDPNRPEKLAEQFREIYDNAWTDVLDYITENTEATDEIAVKLIVDVLKLMYEECRGNIHRRKLRMIKSIGYTEEDLIKQYTGGKEGHNPVVKLIKDLVRNSVERISDEVTRKTKELQDVKKVLQDGKKHGDLFVTKCIKLCLYMCTQDPPVILDFNIKNGDIFDKDRLSPFTVSGDVIDYLVWPIMYLSDRGVLMSKGIAQGKKGGDK